MPWDSSATYEDSLAGKQTFVMHNRKTVDEYHVEGKMGNKKKLSTMYE